jgi:hypothetical protein
MTATEKHMLEALKTFIGADYIQKNLNVIDELQRFLSIQLMNEELDADTYDKYCWLLWRFKDMLEDMKIATDTIQLFRECSN